MANKTYEINTVVEVSGKLYNGKWAIAKDNDNAIEYKHKYDLAGLSADELVKYATANLCVVHHAFIKRKTETAAAQYLKDNEGGVIDVTTFTSGGGTVGLFKECFGGVKALRNIKMKDVDIIAALADEYGEANVRAVCEGKNPWKTATKAAPKKDKPKAGSVKALTQLQKEAILRTAKQVKAEMAEELEAADMLDETMRLAEIPKALHGIGKVYAGQIIK